MVVSSGQEVDGKRNKGREERGRGGETEERKHEKNVFETHANVSIRF